MSSGTIPRHEPEIIEAIAAKHYCGDDEKVATTSIETLVIRGVRLESRYRKAREFELMRAMVPALPGPHREAVASIFCDSKASYCFSVVLRQWSDRDARAVGIYFQQVLHSAPPFGHNGILIADAGYSQRLELDPCWIGEDSDE
jgi:hypothetical protein